LFMAPLPVDMDGCVNVEKNCNLLGQRLNVVVVNESIKRLKVL